MQRLILDRTEARVCRARRGLTQSDLAAALGISKSQVCRLERGQIEVDPGLVAALVAALGGTRKRLFRRAIRAVGL